MISPFKLRRDSAAARFKAAPKSSGMDLMVMFTRRRYRTGNHYATILVTLSQSAFSRQHGSAATQWPGSISRSERSAPIVSS